MSSAPGPIKEDEASDMMELSSIQYESEVKLVGYVNNLSYTT